MQPRPGNQNECSAIDLSQVRINPQLMKLIPPDLAYRYGVIPVALHGSTLLIAMADPSNIFAVDDIKFLTGYRIDTCPAPEDALRLLLDSYYQTPARVSGRLHGGADGGAEVVIVSSLPVGGSRCRVAYSVEPGGVLTVELRYEPGEGKIPLLPKVGMQLGLPKGYDRIEWYGRGPQETYCDRKTGGEIALHARTLEEFIYAYIRPQDNANRTDVRWVRFLDASGKAILTLALVATEQGLDPRAEEAYSQAWRTLTVPAT